MRSRKGWVSYIASPKRSFTDDDKKWKREKGGRGDTYIYQREKGGRKEEKRKENSLRREPRRGTLLAPRVLLRGRQVEQQIRLNQRPARPMEEDQLLVRMRIHILVLELPVELPAHAHLLLPLLRKLHLDRQVGYVLVVGTRGGCGGFALLVEALGRDDRGGGVGGRPGGEEDVVLDVRGYDVRDGRAGQEGLDGGREGDRREDGVAAGLEFHCGDEIDVSGGFLLSLSSLCMLFSFSFLLLFFVPFFWKGGGIVSRKDRGHTEGSSPADLDASEAGKGDGEGRDAGDDFADDHHILWGLGDEFLGCHIRRSCSFLSLLFFSLSLGCNSGFRGLYECVKIQLDGVDMVDDVILKYQYLERGVRLLRVS